LNVTATINQWTTTKRYFNSSKKCQRKFCGHAV
jgi:hypothetical protein